MSKTESGRIRIEANEERVTRTMAEQIEHGDHAPPIVPGGEAPAPAHRGFLERDGGGVEAGISSDNLPGSTPRPRDAGVQDAYRDRAREYNGPVRTAERPTSEPSGGVSDAMGVPTDEAHAAEAPVGDTMDTDV